MRERIYPRCACHVRSVPIKAPTGSVCPPTSPPPVSPSARPLPSTLVVVPEEQAAEKAVGSLGTWLAWGPEACHERGCMMRVRSSFDEERGKGEARSDAMLISRLAVCWLDAQRAYSTRWMTWDGQPWAGRCHLSGPVGSHVRPNELALLRYGRDPLQLRLMGLPLHQPPH